MKDNKINPKIVKNNSTLKKVPLHDSVTPHKGAKSLLTNYPPKKQDIQPKKNTDNK